MVRETSILILHVDERLIPTTLKPHEEVNSGRVITSTRNAFEAGRDDPKKVFNDEDFNAQYGRIQKVSSADIISHSHPPVR